MLCAASAGRELNPRPLGPAQPSGGQARLPLAAPPCSRAPSCTCGVARWRRGTGADGAMDAARRPHALQATAHSPLPHRRQRHRQRPHPPQRRRCRASRPQPLQRGRCLGPPEAQPAAGDVRQCGRHCWGRSAAGQLGARAAPGSSPPSGNSRGQQAGARRPARSPPHLPRRAPVRGNAAACWASCSRCSATACRRRQGSQACGVRRSVQHALITPASGHRWRAPPAPPPCRLHAPPEAARSPAVGGHRRQMATQARPALTRSSSSHGLRRSASARTRSTARAACGQAGRQQGTRAWQAGRQQGRERGRQVISRCVPAGRAAPPQRSAGCTAQPAAQAGTPARPTAWLWRAAAPMAFTPSTSCTAAK